MNFFDSLFRLISMHRTDGALRRLSDHQLQDIGIRREQITDRVRLVHDGRRFA